MNLLTTTEGHMMTWFTLSTNMRHSPSEELAITTERHNWKFIKREFLLELRGKLRVGFLPFDFVEHDQCVDSISI